MFPDHTYANHTTDEVWTFGVTAELRESRVEQGYAKARWRDKSMHIEASDRLPSEMALRLRQARGDDHQHLRQVIETSLRGQQATARIISKTRLVENDDLNDIEKSTTATIHFPDGISITVTPDDAANQLDRLHKLRSSRPVAPSPPRPVALVWRGGSGAVLLHEAIGHPAERETFGRWPSWLEVIDSSSSGIDDTGMRAEVRHLTAGQPPAAFRRQDFRSIPLRRLSNLIVRSSALATALPDPRIEVWVVGSGGYDPVAETIRLHVSLARLVAGDRSTPAAPFMFEARREEISARLEGAAGTMARYPGVICFDDGQYLPVGSFAPDLILA